MATAANKIIATSVVLLSDAHGPEVQLPLGGFTGSEAHNVASPKFSLGTRITYYDRTAKDYVTMRYARFDLPSTTVACAAGQICTTAYATHNTSLYKMYLTNSTAYAMIGVGGPGLVALSAMTTDYYGWFWEAGPCPQMTAAATSGLAAAYLYVYNDITVVTGTSLGVIGADSTDGLAIITPAAYGNKPFAYLKTVAMTR